MDAVFSSQRTCRRAHCTGRAGRGFTLVELIIVLVLLSVLAVVAAPRIFNTGDFNARGFKDQTLALLRFAQKTAIAQRRTVCVTFTLNSATLSIASAAGVTICDNTPMSGPNGEIPPTVVGKGGSAYTALPASMQFDGLGQPYGGSPLAALTAVTTITVAGSTNPVLIEPSTGYVHE